MATKTINEQWSIDESETVSLDDMKYTVIRVKRKITDDPEKALSVNSKKRRVDDIFQYCGSLPLNSSDAKIKEITIGRKRTADSLKEKVVTSLTTIENKLHSPKPERKKSEKYE